MTPTANAILIDAYTRVAELVHTVLDGLTEEQLTARVGPDANTIGWLVWHLSRVQDKHIADLAGSEQAWTAAGWHERFGLPFDAAASGYGHTSAEVAAVKGIGADQFVGYFDAVHARTVDYLKGLSDEDFARIVDTRWDPPVTLAVRLVSAAADDLQHVGQAAFIRGLLA